MKKTPKTILPKKSATLFSFALLLGIVSGISLANFPANNSQVAQLTKTPEVYFSKQDAHFSTNKKNLIDAIIEKINTATSSIHIAMFSLTNPNIVDALLRAKQRGVELHIIVDTRFSKQKAIKQLAKHTPNIYVATLKKKACFHHKFAVIDEKSLITGSGNWSKSANEQNKDHILFIESESEAAQYLNTWKKYKQHKDVARYGQLST